MTKIALKGFLAQKFKGENTVDNSSELDQDNEAGNKAAQSAWQYTDWLLSNVNPNPPDKDM